MRLISNEELVYVAGGEYDSQYTPIWQLEEADNFFSSNFDSYEFGDGYAGAKKTTPKKPTQSEMAQVIEQLRKVIPGATVQCTATANNKGPEGSVQWEISCGVTFKTKG